MRVPGRPQARVPIQPASGRCRSRISGPLLDRMDIQIEVPAVDYRDLSIDTVGESSAVVKERVERARAVQRERLGNDRIYCNAQMKNRHITRFCKLDNTSLTLLERAMESMGLSARAYHRILKFARTIADLDAGERITPTHIAEAIQYRSLERKAG